MTDQSLSVPDDRMIPAQTLFVTHGSPAAYDAIINLTARGCPIIILEK